MNLIFVKLGGSLITDKAKPFTEKKDVIKRLAEEIHRARQKKDIKLIIGHGGGSYPHKPASDYQVQKGVINKDSYKGIAEVQDAASRLNRLIVRALLDAGELAVSVQPSSSCITEQGRIKEFYTEPIKKFLDYNMIPITYGDVALDTKMGCCIISTEEVLNFLTKEFKPERIILCGKVDGVLDAQNKVIPEITEKNFAKIKPMLLSSDGIDITGGMLHKVERMLELKVPSYIINGTKEGNLEKALLGEKIGTEIK